MTVNQLPPDVVETAAAAFHDALSAETGLPDRWFEYPPCCPSDVRDMYRSDVTEALTTTGNPAEVLHYAETFQSWDHAPPGTRDRFLRVTARVLDSVTGMR